MIFRHQDLRRRKALIAGAAGVLLGVPSLFSLLPSSPGRTLHAADPVVRPQDALLQAIVERETQSLGVIAPDASAGVQPVSGEMLVQYQQAAPSVVPNQQSPQYQPAGQYQQTGSADSQYSSGAQSEVQRELQMLYQQDGRAMPQMEVPQFSNEARRYAPVSGRRSRPWDFLNPAQWKRKYEQSRRQSRPSQPQETGQIHSGTPAPLPQVQMSAPPAVPMPAQQAAQQPLPRVQRVSPEIFALEPSSPSTQATPSTDPQSPFAGQPGPFPGPVDSAHPAVTGVPSDIPTESTSGAPLLIILPEPATAADAPPPDAGTFAEPQPAPVGDAPVGESATNGLPEWAQEESSPRLEQPLPGLEDTLDRTAGDPLADPFPAGSEAQADQQAAPFTGLQLEMDPYGEPLPTLPSAPPADQTPVIAPNIPSYDSGSFSPSSELPAAPPAQDDGPSRNATDGSQPPAELPRVIPQQPIPVPQTGLTAPSSAEHSISAADKMARIAERQGLKGFKGFCPVMLRDYRELADARLEHSAIYQGNQYWFSSAEARQAFITNPGAYVPASGGIDVVLFQQTGRQELGSLDYAVWYRSRLYLFTSEATKAEFVTSPRTHALDQAAAP